MSQRTISEKAEPAARVSIDYTNYKGERKIRIILPQMIWFGHTEHHPEHQWILEAWDLEKNALRSFAMRDIHKWETLQ